MTRHPFAQVMMSLYTKAKVKIICVCCLLRSYNLVQVLSGQDEENVKTNLIGEDIGLGLQICRGNEFLTQHIIMHGMN